MILLLETSRSLEASSIIDPSSSTEPESQSIPTKLNVFLEYPILEEYFDSNSHPVRLMLATESLTFHPNSTN
jgi:hypothetical protein